MTVRKKRPATKTHTGISNRETAEQEAAERREHPPLDGGSPPPDGEIAAKEDGLPAAGDQMSQKKIGLRSASQKASGSRYPDRAAPQTRKVGGAYGRESADPLERDRRGTSHPGRGHEPAT
jgi:hypothetical protein